MPDDLRALLAAIVADPADDTARLVYADCLQEHGNIPRADFIRLQIEAERLHPDSNARARLEEQAQRILSEHWIDWWREVCAGVGLPPPVSKPNSRLGHLVCRAGIRSTPGDPYELADFTIRPVSNRPIHGFASARFVRGFPESLYSSGLPEMGERDFLAYWQMHSPITELVTPMYDLDTLFDEFPLGCVQKLTLLDYFPGTLIQSPGPPRLTRLKELTLRCPDFFGPLTHDDSESFAAIFTSPHVLRLLRLSIQLWAVPWTEVFRSAEHLSGLMSLEIVALSKLNRDRAIAAERLRELARSSHLAGLQELRVIGEIDSAGIEAVIRGATWTGLRSLELDSRGWYERLDALAETADLPALEELRLVGVRHDAGALATLAVSPLLNQLRHLSLRGHYPGGAFLPAVADALNSNRVETFALSVDDVPSRIVDGLRSRFGDRLRLLRRPG